MVRFIVAARIFGVKKILATAKSAKIFQHSMLRQPMALVFLIPIIVGLASFVLVTRGPMAHEGIMAALAVFMIFIGFNGLLNIRIQKLEDKIKELEEKLPKNAS